MPSFKKSYRKKRSSSRRYGKKRYAKKQKTTLVNRGLKPFASRYITKMKYSEAYTLSALNNYTQIMNLNSVFDPNRTGIGHQPYGYDQLTPLYNRYRVISASYVINAYSGAAPIRFGCLPLNEVPSFINDMSELCENPRAKWKVQMPQGSTSILTGKVYLPSLVGRTKSQYMADDRFQAQTNASPLELAVLFISAQSMGNVNVDTNLTVTIEYLVEFFDTNPIDQS